MQEEKRMINQRDKATEHFKSGLLYASQGNYQEAIKEYNAAIWLDPGNFSLYERRGKAYSEIMDIEHSLMDYYFCCKQIEQIINNNSQDIYTPLIPIYVDALNGLALILLVTGKIHEAIQKLKTALKYNQAHAKTYELLGTAYIRLNDYEKSVEAHSMAIELEPNISHYYFSRGWSYRFLGKLENTVADLTRAHELDPENNRISEDLREVRKELMEKKIFDITREYLTGNAPKDPIYTSVDVKNDIARHEWESAIQKCDKIITRNADDFETRALRASILIDAYCDYASAISDYSMAAYYAHLKGDKRYSEYEAAKALAVEKIEKLFSKYAGLAGGVNDNKLLSGTTWLKNKSSMLDDVDFYYCFWDNENYCVRLGREKEGELETGTYELLATILKTIPLGKSPSYHNFSGDIIFCGEDRFRKSGGGLPPR
jgi:tetratricopeptide (TPR) repeat protein